MTTNRGVDFFDKYSKFFVSIAQHIQNRPEYMQDNQITVLQKTVSKLFALNYAAPHFIYEEDILAVYWRKNNFYLSIELEESGVHSWAATDSNQLAIRKIVWKTRSNKLNDILQIFHIWP